MFGPIIDQTTRELLELTQHLKTFEPQLQRLGQALLDCWRGRGKVLLAGNGGSAADAMHFAEELTVRYKKNRRALAAVALADVTAISCAGNDFGYDTVFARQVEALGNPGDVFVGFTTSGNSASILRALDVARRQQVTTVTFLGKDGGRARGQADIEFLVPSPSTARIQEIHQVLFHMTCEWVDAQVD